jgi:predicted transposase/invertase (TIGR01784 family)
MTKGREESRAEGRAEEKLTNARSLKANGVPLDIIAKSLNLTDKEIAEL